MLWFNDYFNFLLDKKIAFQYILCCGSTPFNTLFLLLLLSFQYILCCGSTAFKDTYVTISQYFNTSYVVVQRVWKVSCPFSNADFNTSYVVVQLTSQTSTQNQKTISIHLMLWFNERVRRIKESVLEFQYILCCGSTVFVNNNISKIIYISIHLMLWFNNHKSLRYS